MYIRFLCVLVYYFLVAAITNNYKLGGLRELYFLTFLEDRNLKSVLLG